MCASEVFLRTRATFTKKANRLCRALESVAIEIPPDIDTKIDCAVRQLGKCEAACIWCSHGYHDYTREAEDQHFAHECPNAPEELRERAKARLLFGGKRENDDSSGRTA